MAASIITFTLCVHIIYFVIDVNAFPAEVHTLTNSKMLFMKWIAREHIGREDVSEHTREKRQLNVIQSKINDLVHPQPIVDTLREEDKYGNMVEHTFGKNIVKVVENISNVINTVFAFPIDTVKKASRTATEVLNNIGGKIVGLQ